MFYFLDDQTLSSDPYPPTPLPIAHWCCAPWNVAFLRMLGSSCLFVCMGWGATCLALKYLGDVHSFAQNCGHFSVSSGIEHCCGQFRTNLIFTFLRWFAFFHLDSQRIPSLSLRFGNSPWCVLLWSWDVFWLFQRAVSRVYPLIQEALKGVSFNSGSLCPVCPRTVCTVLLESYSEHWWSTVGGCTGVCHLSLGLWAGTHWGCFPASSTLSLEASLGQESLSW